MLDRAPEGQCPQPHEPPQHPPPPPEGPLNAGFDEAPCTAKLENCLSTFAAPHSGHVTAWSLERTSSSKCDSHSMHAYS